MSRTLMLGGALLAAVGLGGCAEPSHLVVYQRTVVGFDAVASTSQSSGHITLGYDRRFTSLVPKTRIREDGKPETVEAMSIISCTEVETRGLQSVEFAERLATGDAAHEYAKKVKSNPSDASFRCVNQTP